MTQWYKKDELFKAIADARSDPEPASVIRVHTPDRFAVIRGVAGGLVFQEKVGEIQQVYPGVEITSVDVATVDVTAEEISKMLEPFAADNVHEDLDDMVHDAASAEASIVNNQGISDQVDYLVNQFGAGSVLEMAQKLVSSYTGDDDAK
jgi:hypothetical protein